MMAAQRGSQARKIWRRTGWGTRAKKGSDVLIVPRPSPICVDCNNTLTSTPRRLSLVKRDVAGAVLEPSTNKLICSCPRRFLGKTQLETHLEKCHGSGVGTGMTQDDLIFRCNICSAQFSDYQRVQEHIGSHGEQLRGEGQVQISFLGLIRPILCVQVVISIEGMGEGEEETFTEEINTFVISVEDDQSESGLYVTEPPIKYTLVE